MNDDKKKYNPNEYTAIFVKVKIAAIECFIKGSLPRFFLHH